MMVTASGGTAPLLCGVGKTNRTGSLVPTGPFTCAVQNPYLGVYTKPYPKCVEASCAAPPVATGVSMFSKFTTEGASNGTNCTNISSTMTMPHGGQCAFFCDTGYTMKTAFRCNEGVFEKGECVPKTCSDGDIINSVDNGKISCDSADGIASFDTTCKIVCNKYYEQAAQGDSKCTSTSTGPSAVPSFNFPTGTDRTSICKMKQCPAPTVANAVVTQVAAQQTMCKADPSLMECGPQTKWTVTCTYPQYTTLSSPDGTLAASCDPEADTLAITTGTIP